MATFGNRTAAPTQAPTRALQSKYAGITGAANQREPMLSVGTYRCEIVKCVKGINPGTRKETMKIYLRVITAEGPDTTPPGTHIVFLAGYTAPGLADAKRFAMAATGFAPTIAQRADPRQAKIAVNYETAYDVFEASQDGGSGCVLAASFGEIAAPALDLGAYNPPLQVDVVVSRGKDVPNPQTGQPTGDYFRQYVWSATPEGQQPLA